MFMRKLTGKICRFLFPFYGFCLCCNRTWNVCEGHTTIYRSEHEGRVIEGCFPLCEACWKELSIPNRIPYYRKLLEIWQEQGTDKTDEDFKAIFMSVLAGN